LANSLIRAILETVRDTM